MSLISWEHTVPGLFMAIMPVPEGSLPYIERGVNFGFNIFFTQQILNNISEF